MKKITTFLLALLFALPLIAQVPGKMSYQAVVRDKDNTLISNSMIGLRISILQYNNLVVYEEIQTPVTNDNGLISIEFGGNEAFSKINWAEGTYFIKTEIDPNGGDNYTVNGTSQILSVPYALYALSAGTLTENFSREGEPGVTSQNWSLFGNFRSNPLTDKLGTTDAADLILVTNNLERMRILANGDIDMGNSLDVGANLKVQGNTDLDGTLNVDGATDLNNTLNVDGETDLNSALRVNNLSPTNLSGLLEVDGATTLHDILTVDGATDLNNTLNVDGETDLNSALRVNNLSPTNLTGILEVDGETDLNDDLRVNNLSPTNLSGLLEVDGATTLHDILTVDGATDLNSTLNVDGETDLNSALRVNNQSPTNLSGLLEVDEATTLHDILTVDGASTLHDILTVDGATDLNSTLNVDGETDLNSALRVNNLSPSILTGTLRVDGATDLNSMLSVDGSVDFYNSLEVDGPVDFNYTLTVDGATDLNNTLNVDGITDLNEAFNVNNNSPSHLTGSLEVDGITDLNAGFNVNNASPVHFTGSLEVDGATDLNTTLNVDGASTLKSTLGVDGAASLNSTLGVLGATTLSNTLGVTGATNLSSTITVNGAADMNSSLNVDGATNLNNTLSVDGATTINNTTGLNGQVTISASLGGGESSYGAYPLRVQGSGQGIAVKLTAGTPNNSNNFITFFDSGGGAVGRIEGETAAEKAATPEFIFEQSILIAEEVAAGVNVGLALIPIVVGGLGVSAGPCSPCIAITIADLVLATANLVAFNAFELTNMGVTYQSGSADYAEWLERNNPGEFMSAGDIVGVYSGKISKYTQNARQFLVISTKPAMLGNMPTEGQEYLYEKVAFMGQIPVKVKGIVFAGDYILPSGLNDGTGIAVSPEEIKAEQYREIVGVAWSNSLNHNGVSLINMAIGLNANDVANLAVQQEKKIRDIENQYKSLEERLLSLENGTDYAPAKEVAVIPPVNAQIPQEKQMTRAEMVEAYMPAEISDEIMEDAMLYLENAFREKGINITEYPSLNKLFNDAAYKAEIMRKTKENYKISYQQLIRKAQDMD